MALVYTYNGETDYTDGLSSFGWAPQNYIYGGRITFAESGDVDQLGCYGQKQTGSDVDVSFALYDTSGNLVITGGSVTVNSTTGQWWDASNTSASVSGADYFILYSATSDRMRYGYDSANDGSFATEGNATFPADPETITAEGDSGSGYGGRANFTASGGGSGPNLLTLLGVG